MAGKKASGSRVAGKTFAFTGTPTHVTRAEVAELLEAEGGKVVEEVTGAVDYLVVGTGRGGNATAARKKAGRLNQQGKASITVLEDYRLHELLRPTPEEVLAMLRALPRGVERWRRLMAPHWLRYASVDLSGADLRGVTLKADQYNQITLESLKLDGADFCGATLVGVRFSGVRAARFDGADLRSSSFGGCEGCSFKDADLRGASVNDVTRCVFDGARITKDGEAGYTSFSGTSKHCSAVGADLTGARLNPADLSHGDFSRAKLRVETASYTVARSAVFREADLRGAELDESKFVGADFTRADLTEARLNKCDFKDANFEGAKLVRADLRNANLSGANLSGADLRGANLNDADLKGARVDGADFADANLGGARTGRVDFSRAKNFDPAGLNPPGAVGPNIRQLAEAAKQSKRLVATAELDVAGQRVDVLVAGWNGRSGFHPGANYTQYHANGSDGSSVGAPTFEQGMLNLAKRWPRGRLKLETVTVEAERAPQRGKGLTELAVGAWCEAFGIEPPTAGELAGMEKQKKAGRADLREQMLADLRAGAAGVERWNAVEAEQRQAVGHFRKLDLSKQKLAGIHLARLDFQGAVFDNADLRKAVLGNADLRGTSFRGARLGGARLPGARLPGASFEGAGLAGCNLRAIKSFRDVSFRGADLTKADFSHSDLRGADLSGAVLSAPKFYGTRFDERTRFPAGFKLSEEGLMWAGTGPDPRLAPPAAGPPAGSLDFAGFLDSLRGQADSAALARALAMLKADRFQLFAEAEADHLAGVVKSQSDPGLVYSCRLAADGSYGCCTQNLRRCGGLRGSPCKHLLVLVVGLARAGTLDAATVDCWVRAGRARRPAIDEDAMSATLLRYKGAEAGEIDWRPTETIPEDFYAL
jgi:uncharacterized protein YjbI with pentapeptide repeats